MGDDNISVAAIIPAHLASVRFPRKVLFPFFGFPMVEHVRRRALLSQSVNEVYVATCDHEIADAITANGGNVIFTHNKHSNGTSRVAEAAQQIRATHIILLQGDEPLLLPSYVDLIAQTIINNPKQNSWNATGPIEKADEMDKHSFVKCAVTSENRILHCFRRSPSYASFIKQKKYIRKILGVIAFRSDFLQEITSLEPSEIEISESIEQMRIIENGYVLNSIPFDESLPSVNEPHESETVIQFIRKKAIQRELLFKTFNIEI